VSRTKVIKYLTFYNGGHSNRIVVPAVVSFSSPPPSSTALNFSPFHFFPSFSYSQSPNSIATCLFLSPAICACFHFIGAHLLPFRDDHQPTWAMHASCAREVRTQQLIKLSSHPFKEPNLEMQANCQKLLSVLLSYVRLVYVVIHTDLKINTLIQN